VAFNNERHHRRSIRLRGYDYQEAGAYFVTVCTANRECFFGEIVDEAMQLNRLGEIVEDEWHRTAILRPQVSLDAFVVMPNHVHGIVCYDAQEEGKARLAPTMACFGHPVAGSLPAIVGAFKSASSKRINEIRGTLGAPLWQRNYFEHVIRNEQELNSVREYIASNPARWSEDTNNPNGSFAREPQSEFNDVLVGARRALPPSAVNEETSIARNQRRI
jgi:putative transposase